MRDTHRSPRTWRTSSVCPNGPTCVEVTTLPDGGAAMRDGKNPQGAELQFDAVGWAEFIAAAKAGEFDPRPRGLHEAEQEG